MLAKDRLESFILRFIHSPVLGSVTDGIKKYREIPLFPGQSQRDKRRQKQYVTLIIGLTCVLMFSLMVSFFHSFLRQYSQRIAYIITICSIDLAFLRTRYYRSVTMGCLAVFMGYATSIAVEMLQNYQNQIAFCSIYLMVFVSSLMIAALICPPLDCLIIAVSGIILLLFIPSFSGCEILSSDSLDEMLYGLILSDFLLVAIYYTQFDADRKIDSQANALMDARDEALKASGLKTQFVAAMSHELRTPLNGIIGLTSLLLDTPLSSDQRESMENIRTSGKVLLALTGDVLDFSQIETDRFMLEESDFDMYDAVDEVVQVCGGTLGKEVNLLSAILPNVPRNVRGDRTRLQQILVNLLGNANKFTSEGEIVLRVMLASDKEAEVVREHRPIRTVSLDLLPKIPSGLESPGRTRFQSAIASHVTPQIVSVCFEVADTGIGMGKEQMDKLFQPFSQADSSSTRKYAGVGLGLTIAKKLALRMGGNITAESVEGEGATFRATIKLTDILPSALNHLPLASSQTALEGHGVVLVVDRGSSGSVYAQQIEAWGAIVSIVHSSGEGTVSVDDINNALVRNGSRYSSRGSTPNRSPARSPNTSRPASRHGSPLSLPTRPADEFALLLPNASILSSPTSDSSSGESLRNQIVLIATAHGVSLCRQIRVDVRMHAVPLVLLLHPVDVMSGLLSTIPRDVRVIQKPPSSRRLYDALSVSSPRLMPVSPIMRQLAPVIDHAAAVLGSSTASRRESMHSGYPSPTLEHCHDAHRSMSLPVINSSLPVPSVVVTPVDMLSRRSEQTMSPLMLASTAPSHEGFDSPSSTGSGTLSASSSMIFPTIRILIVEDNKMNQMVAQRLLRKIGYPSDIAYNGKEGVEMVTNNPDAYSLILMDCHMPIMDGFEATHRLREKGFAIPIIALTADVAEGKDHWIAHGMDDYVSKPIDLEALRLAIEKQLQIHSTIPTPAPQSPVRSRTSSDARRSPIIFDR